MTTWMIVEDEPGIYEMLLAMSEVLGNEGVAFVDGDEAIAWIDEVDSGRYEGELPELALVDIRLPTETSGPMVGARLRKSPRVNGMGIVLMTAYHLKDEEKQELIDQAGADLLLTKPLPSIAVMQSTLAEVVAKRAAMSPAAAPAVTSTTPAPTPPVSPAPTPASATSNAAQPARPGASVPPPAPPDTPAAKPKRRFF